MMYLDRVIERDKRRRKERPVNHLRLVKRERKRRFPIPTEDLLWKKIIHLPDGGIMVRSEIHFRYTNLTATSNSKRFRPIYAGGVKKASYSRPVYRHEMYFSGWSQV